jgi:hypothetical protein
MLDDGVGDAAAVGPAKAGVVGTPVGVDASCAGVVAVGGGVGSWELPLHATTSAALRATALIAMCVSVSPPIKHSASPCQYLAEMRGPCSSRWSGQRLQRAVRPSGQVYQGVYAQSSKKDSLPRVDVGTYRNGAPGLPGDCSIAASTPSIASAHPAWPLQSSRSDSHERGSLCYYVGSNWARQDSSMR